MPASNTRTRRRERRALSTRAEDVVTTGLANLIADEEPPADMDTQDGQNEGALVETLAVEPPPDPSGMDTPEPVMTWEGPLAIEGANTEDGRRLEPNSISWRDLPLTLMAQVVTDEGHDGAQVAGRIDTIERRGDEIYATGVFDDSDYGRDIARLVKDKTLRGVSVDLAILEMQWETMDGAVLDEDAAWLVEDPVVMVVTKGMILGATVCPFQAIADAQIAVVASKAPSVSWRTKVRVPFNVVAANRAPTAAEAGATGGSVVEVLVTDDRLSNAVGALLEANLPERMTAYKEAVEAGFLSINEVRATLGRPSIPGGDRLAHPTPEGIDPAVHATLSALSTIAETLAAQRIDDRVLAEVREAITRAPRVVRVEPQDKGPDAASLVAAALSDIGSRFASSNASLADAVTNLAERPAPTVTINERSRNVDAIRDDQGRVVGYREVAE